MRALQLFWTSILVNRGTSAIPAMDARLPVTRLVATALVSCTVLLLEIAVTRILSVLLWYHWAFFSISAALLGLGAPGVWWTLKGLSREALPRALLGASVCLPLAMVLMVKGVRWFAPFSVVYCLVCLLPGFLCLGTALALLVLDGPEDALAPLYGADLAGALAGAVLAVPLMDRIAAPTLAAGLALLPLFACLMLEPRRTPRVILLMAGVMVLILLKEPLRVRQTKAYDEGWPGFEPIYERWTATTRITVHSSVFWRPTGARFGWGFGRLPAAIDPAPEQYWLEQDGSAGTPITRLRGSPRELAYLLEDVTAVGYHVRFPKSVAVVGAGGGRDILAALVSGAERVDAIELNRAIVDALRGPFGGFSGHVYDLPGVRTVVGDGRSVLSRSTAHYDLIQIALTDSWAATAAGAYALAENSLYTLEAYRLYWTRLSPAGMVSTSRWMGGSSRLEMPRLLILAKAALSAEGVAHPEAHFALVQAGLVGTLVISRSPWTEGERLEWARLSARLGFALDWPLVEGSPEASETARILAGGPNLYRSSGLRLDPPTDDRPFFFQMASPWHRLDPAIPETKGLTLQPVLVLRTLMAVVTVLALVLFLGPWWSRRKRLRGPELGRASLYFVLTGLGFMLVETAWIQSFILYLGSPSWATATVLGALLLGSAVGAVLSPRISLGAARHYGWLSAGGIVGSNLALGPLATSTWGASLAVRVGLVMLTMLPSGVLLGFGLPLGMRRFGRSRQGWYWALSGVSGVLGAVFSLALAMEFGFTRVCLLGALAYGSSWLLLLGKRPDAGFGAPKKPAEVLVVNSVTTIRPTCS
jgi:spermidine synthase